MELNYPLEKIEMNESEKLEVQFLKYNSLFAETGFKESPKQKEKYVSLIKEIYKNSDLIFQEAAFRLMQFSRDKINLLSIEKSLVKKINFSIISIFRQLLFMNYIGEIKKITKDEDLSTQVKISIKTNLVFRTLIPDNSEILQSEKILILGDLNNYFRIELKIMNLPLITLQLLKESELKRDYLPNKKYTPEMFEDTWNKYTLGEKKYIAARQTLEVFNIDWTKLESYIKSYDLYLKKRK
jgi:hypothetical protein